MSVSKRLRFEILRRDNHTCRYCGSSAPDVTLTVDHVVPTALGGGDQPDNLVAACKDCNAGKSSVPAGAPLVDDIAADALRWKYAMDVARTGAAVNRRERDEIRETFDIVWTSFTFGPTKYVCPRDAAWPLSVDRFIEAGLEVDDLCDAMDTAMMMTKVQVGEKWRYFCGIAWSMVSQRQTVATAIARRLAAEDRTPGVTD